MANRSTFNSVFPRNLKKMWALEKYENAHEAGEIKRLWIAAHAAHRAAKMRQAKRTNIDANDADLE